MNVRNRRLDLIEVALLSVLMICVGMVGGYSYAGRTMNTRVLEALSAESRSLLEALSAESRALAATYGPETNSQYQEEWILRDFFKDKREGVFVDVGANHYQHFNNTFYLETRLGWSGVAIEPLREFEADYIARRPRTRFRAFFVSDASNEVAKMYYLKNNPLVTSADKGFTARSGKDAVEKTAPTITLDDLLAAEHIERFDFLSMDIELHEPRALAGFDVQRFRPALVCIEGHPEVRQQILDYFTQRGYVLVGKYLRADVINLYFTPLAAPGEPRRDQPGRF
jgi:FkbM family methyltransferase